MPRVSSENSEAPKRAPRRRVAKPKVASAVASTPVAAPRRKSPTVLPTNTERAVVSRRKVSSKKYVALGLMISGLAIAAFVGYSDKGQIDISAVISERNAKLSAGVSDSEGGETTSVTVPVQNNSTLPNGGLVGSTEPATVPAPLPPIEETATTTSTSTASSTEEIVATEESVESNTDEEVVTEATTETAETEGSTI